MKVLHVPFCYFPDPAGGTEVYAGALAGRQLELGMTPAIAAPASENASYWHDGIPVYRFKTSPKLDLRDQYGDGDGAAAEAFDEIHQRRLVAAGARGRPSKNPRRVYLSHSDRNLRPRHSFVVGRGSLRRHHACAAVRALRLTGHWTS
jgi:hypothetical protein